MLRVRGVCSGKKISMNKIYIFWELESRFGSWEPQSGPPENFPPPYLFLKNNFLAKWPLFHEQQDSPHLAEICDYNFIGIFNVWVKKNLYQLKAFLLNYWERQSKIFLFSCWFCQDIDLFFSKIWGKLLLPCLYYAGSCCNIKKQLWGHAAHGMDIDRKFLEYSCAFCEYTKWTLNS